MKTRENDTAMDGRRVEEAVRRVQEGDVAAYRTVVQAYQRRLRAAIWGSCPPSVDPDEIAHMAFIEAYKRIDRYEPNTRFWTWLTVIAKNLLMAEYTKIKRQARNRENYINHLITDGLDEDVSRADAIEDDRSEALKECMALLRDKAQHVLRLRYAENVKLETIAAKIGKSVSAVKFELFAIRKKLRECIRKKLAFVNG
ncbi:MAG: sigma-70 family RNA polymerase sigma factor [Kiritimatiellae bacterium]|nr:sigma-70 family RNA polymerase sigma factor [Kiritimatiellia bacterium]